MKKMLGLMLVVLSVMFGGCGSKQEATPSPEVVEVTKEVSTPVIEKGDLNDNDYLVKVYKVALEFEKLEENEVVETYKNLATKNGVHFQDLVDVRVGVKNYFDDYYKMEDSTAHLDGNTYTMTRFNRIVYGDVQEAFYEEINRVKSGENPVGKVEIADLIKEYQSIEEVIDMYGYKPGDRIEEDMLYEIMDEIVYTDFYDKKTTLKSDDPTTVTTIVNAAVKVFGKDALNDYIFARDLVEISFYGYNFNMYGVDGEDRTKDTTGVIPEEKVEAAWQHMIAEKEANKK